jgi:transposase InsO family protein
MIREQATTGHSVKELCELFEVSASGYYAWINRKPGKRAVADQTLVGQIQQVHTFSRRTYGSPRITKTLRKQGVKCGKKRVARLMKQKGLHGAQKARFRPRTTDSRHDLPISPNRLADLPSVDRVNQVWVSDITYIPTLEGWLYLAAFMDLKSRTIKGWTIRDHMRTELVETAFRQAVYRAGLVPGLIAHSDRGSQYASREFRSLLDQHQVLSSMSAKGNCYDNASMESFWATLKSELGIKKPFTTKEEARLAIFDYIEVFYNRRRIHSAIGDTSPLDYELKLVA